MMAPTLELDTGLHVAARQSCGMCDCGIVTLSLLGVPDESITVNLEDWQIFVSRVRSGEIY
jgi:hypothetical protein